MHRKVFLFRYLFLMCQRFRCSVRHLSLNDDMCSSRTIAMPTIVDITSVSSLVGGDVRLEMVVSYALAHAWALVGSIIVSLSCGASS